MKFLLTNPFLQKESTTYGNFHTPSCEEHDEAEQVPDSVPL